MMRATIRRLFGGWLRLGKVGMCAKWVSPPIEKLLLLAGESTCTRF